MMPTLVPATVGGQMDYEDYIANLTRMAVDIVNTGAADGDMFAEHHVRPPSPADLALLAPLLRAALEAISAGGGLDEVNRLLAKYPPDLHLSRHDGTPHLHHARDGEAGLTWVAAAAR